MTKNLSIDQCREYINQHLFTAIDKPIHEKLGIELEMFPFTYSKTKNDISSTPFQKSILWMTSYAQEKNWKITKEKWNQINQTIKFTLENKDTLTFEPGGQIEYSSAPSHSLCRLKKQLESIQHQLNQIFKKHQSFLVQTGLNPKETTKTLELQVTKDRYRCMDQYFKALSPYGQQMMRLTSAIHVNLDFSENEHILAKRYLASQLLTPFASAIFANSPLVQNNRTLCKGYRSKIWRSLDPTRTGFPPLEELAHQINKHNCISSYLEFALKSNVIFIQRAEKILPVLKKTSLQEWIKDGINGIYPNIEDFKLCLSLLFPMVRPKGFIELRAVDCLPQKWQLIPLSFFSGLLYDSKTLEKSINFLFEDINKLPLLLTLSEHGLSDSYLYEKSKVLLQMSISGYSDLPYPLKDDATLNDMKTFYATYTSKRKVPADSSLNYKKQ